MYKFAMAVGILSCAALWGCGDEGVDESEEIADFGDAGDIGADEAALTRAYDYKCTRYGNSPGPTPTIGYVRLRGTVASIGERKTWADAVHGNYDARYTTQPDKARFNGFGGTEAGFRFPSAMLVTKAMRRGGTALKSGGKGGFMTLQYQFDEGFFSNSYVCKKATGLGADEGSAPVPATPPGTPDANGQVQADGGPYDAALAAAMLRVANEKSEAQLISEVRLATNYAHAIATNRPYANLVEVGDVRTIGPAAMFKIRDWVQANGWVQ